MENKIGIEINPGDGSLRFEAIGVSTLGWSGAYAGMVDAGDGSVGSTYITVKRIHWH